MTTITENTFDDHSYLDNTTRVVRNVITVFGIKILVAEGKDRQSVKDCVATHNHHASLSAFVKTSTRVAFLRTPSSDGNVGTSASGINCSPISPSVTIDDDDL